MDTPRRSVIVTMLACTLALTPFAATAQDQVLKPAAPWPTVSSTVSAAIERLMADPRVKRAMDFLREDDSRAIQEMITLTEIPAPTFEEGPKAKEFLNLARASGLKDTRLDKTGNAIAMRPGRGNGPLIVLDAHLDTVFPLGTDVKVKFRDGRYYGPGITDDTRGLAVMLSIARALEAAGIRTVADLMLTGTCGEEGNGDLFGVKGLVRDTPNIAAFIGFEPLPVGAISIQNTASIRYEVRYTAPGGHSFAAFGDVPSAIHAAGRAIAAISDIRPPSEPRTTFTVGIVAGGRSVNTIAPEAKMEIDMRSNGMTELRALERQVLDMVQKAADDENRRWNLTSLQVTTKKIGERPGGITPPDSPIIQASLAAIRATGNKELAMVGISTNAGVPIAAGIPTVVLAPGGKMYGFHALSEAIDPTGTWQGAQTALLTILAIAGVDGLTEPLVARR